MFIIDVSFSVLCVKLLKRFYAHLHSKEMNMTEAFKDFDPSKYFTQQQYAYFRQRQTLIGYERVMQISREWKELKKQFQKMLEQGIDPVDQRVQLLARKACLLKEELTGGDSGIEQTFEKIKEQATQDLTKVDPEEGKLMAYILKAMDTIM